MTRTITRICPTIGFNGPAPIGVHPRLVRAAEKGTLGGLFPAGDTDSQGAPHNFLIHAISTEFRAMYDEFKEGADVVEFTPLGRLNDSQGQWKWPSKDEWTGVYMQGYHEFCRTVPGVVRASFGCPRTRLFGLGSDTRDFHHLPVCGIQFDDVSSRAPQVARWLRRHGRSDVMLETVLTDSPGEPRKATKFVLFKGYSDVIQRVRASIVAGWVARWDDEVVNPFAGDGNWHVGGRVSEIRMGYGYEFGLSRDDLRLSLYLPAKDCSPDPKNAAAPYMTVEVLDRVLPLFIDVSIQGPIPEDHMKAVRKWRDAGPVTNTEVVR